MQEPTVQQVPQVMMEPQAQQALRVTMVRRVLPAQRDQPVQMATQVPVEMTEAQALQVQVAVLPALLVLQVLTEQTAQRELQEAPVLMVYKE